MGIVLPGSDGSLRAGHRRAAPGIRELRRPHAGVRAGSSAAVLIRVLLAAALLLPGAAHARDWLFDVTLDGLPIGTHRYTLRGDGDARRLTSEARFRVRLLFIDAYSYDHHADETWRGDCLAAFDSHTVERGKVTTVTGRAEGGRFVLEGPRGRDDAGACAMTFAYWNPRILAQSVLVNPQTGAPTPVSVETLGRARVRAHGRAQDVTHYRIDTDKTRIEVFYAEDGEWIGLRSTTREGHVLEYRLR